MASGNFSMPGHKVHDTSTLICACLTLFLWSKVEYWYIVGIGVLFGGLLCSPDLDTKSRVLNRWGPLKLYWLPYCWCVNHRSLVSHGPILGTLFRVIYLLPVWALIYPHVGPDIFISFVVGMEISALLHILLDHCLKN